MIPVPPAVRYHAFDALRGTMMLLGIVLHAGAAYSGGAAWFVHDRPSAPVAALLMVIHAFRMPVFFVMSGFFAALLLERLGPTGFVRHRLKRIVVPYVVGWCVLGPLSLAVTGLVMAAHPSAGPPELGRPFALTDALNSMHLWFLEYLVLLSAAALVARRMVRRLVPERLRRATTRAVRAGVGSVRGLLGIAAATTSVYAATGAIALPAPSSMVPQVEAMVIYGVYFGFGWWLYEHRDCLPGFRKLTAPCLLLAALFSAAYVVLIGAVIEAGGSRPGLNLAAVAANAAAAWMALAGFTGLFLRLAGGPSPTWRYLSDSAYWLYLVHPPILVALQGVLMGVPVPSPLKAAIVAAAACPILFASYQLGVRHTLIGRWLNGPRQRGRVSIGSEAPPV